jgi:predicted phage-related endonuclease
VFMQMPSSTEPVAPETNRSSFLGERKKGVGGSDVASVFNVGYGCRLRLWREKRNEQPDYPREDSAQMELGRHLESYFAARFARATGLDVVIKNEPTIHPAFPELRVNVDRMIHAAEDPDEDNIGVLEIKSVGRDVFYKVKREGLPEDYILQLQHGMLCTGCNWGYFAIGCRDNGELLYWRAEGNQLLQDSIVAESLDFWRGVQSGEMPERLEPDDKRCQKCEFRKSCQGAALVQLERTSDLEQDETLRPLLTEYLERKELLDQANGLAEETKEELKSRLGDRQAVEVAGHKVYFRPQVAMLGDFKSLAPTYDLLRNWALQVIREHPELGPQFSDFTNAYGPAESFRKPSPSRPLRVY